MHLLLCAGISGKNGFQYCCTLYVWQNSSVHIAENPCLCFGTANPYWWNFSRRRSYWQNSFVRVDTNV